MDKETIAAYNRFAAEYDAGAVGFWQKFPRTVLDEFAARVKLRGNNVLDLGSGPGHDAKLLRSLGLDVVCVDASRVMAEMTRNKGFLSPLVDFSKLAFKKGSFNGVWAYTSLLHADRDELAHVLEGIHRILTPDGVFGLGMIEGDSEVRGISGRRKHAWCEALFSYYEEGGLQDLLKKTDFNIIFFEKFTPRRSTYMHFVCEKFQG